MLESQEIDELLARALSTHAEKGAGTKQCALSNGGRKIGPAKHYLGNRRLVERPA